MKYRIKLSPSGLRWFLYHPNGYRSQHRTLANAFDRVYEMGTILPY